MKHRLGQLFTVLCVVITAAGLFNVYGDNAEVEAAAKASSPDCAAGCSMTRTDRSPFGQGFQFAAKGGKQVDVHCARALLLVGAYACKPR